MSWLPDQNHKKCLFCTKIAYKCRNFTVGCPTVGQTDLADSSYVN